MKQHTFTVEDAKMFDEELFRLASLPEYVSAKSRLILAFEPKRQRYFMESQVKHIQEFMPGTHLIALTTLGTTHPRFEVPSSLTCSLLLFEESDVSVFSYDCSKMTMDEATFAFLADIESIPDKKGVFFVTADSTLMPETFLDAFHKQHPELPLFGGPAGHEKIGKTDTVVALDGKLCSCGIVAAVFSGEALEIETKCSLGFKPIGRKFEITGYAGSGVVTEIDGKPAVSVYEKYLAVDIGNYFYDNVCAFPFIEKKDNMPAARVPSSYGEDGQLFFAQELPKGTLLTLSYSKPRYLLQESLAVANELAAFQPQAMLGIVCLNRRIFMGNFDADRELDYFRKVMPSAAFFYGYGETLVTEKGGGVLNSSLVAAIMREGERSEDGGVTVEDHDLDPDDYTVAPLEDRLATFLEATTAELHDKVDELAILASHDTLTGLYNRRKMDETLHDLLDGFEEGDNLGILIYDIDFFKDVNDTYGHDVGDIVLQEMTDCVKHSIRGADMFARWGGEEFVIIFQNVSEDVLCSIAERIRKHVEDAEFSSVGKLTISIGATMATGQDTANSLFARVDKALYAAKQTGRNQVCFQ